MTCTPTPECKYYPSCHESVHHLYFPRYEYKTELEKTFRSLAVNTMRLCRQRHDELHATEEPPEKPSEYEMATTVIESQGDYTSVKKRKLVDKLIRRYGGGDGEAIHGS
jgi:hypothetical protein